MKKYLSLALSLFLLFTGLTGIYLTKFSAKSQRITFPVNGEIARGIIYLPAKAETAEQKQKYPLIFLLPGIFTPAESFEPLAMELARRNYAVCALSIPTQRSKFNLKTVIEASKYIENSFPAIDQNKPAIFGHSLGASTAAEAAYFMKTTAIVTAGYYISGELKERPGNFLMGTGLYDDLNGPEKIKKAMKTFDKDVAEKEGYRAGSFADHNALEIFISPYSNHSSETVDFVIYKRLFHWLDMSFFGEIQGKKPLIYHYRYLSFFLFLLGAFLFLIWARILLFPSKSNKNSIIWLTIMLTFPILVFLTKISLLAGVIAFALLFFAYVASNYFSLWHQNSDEPYGKFTQTTGKFAFYLTLFCVSFIMSRFLFSIPIFSSNYLYLSAFPGYIFVSFFLAPLNIVRYLIVFSGTFFPIIFYILLIFCLIWYFVEMKRPGLTGFFIEKLLNRLLNLVKFEKTKKISKKQKTTAALCAIIGILSWFRIYSMGLFNGEVLKPYLIFLLSYIFVPLLGWFILIKISKKLPYFS